MTVCQQMRDCSWAMLACASLRGILLNGMDSTATELLSARKPC